MIGTVVALLLSIFASFGLGSSSNRGCEDGVDLPEARVEITDPR